MYDLMLYSDHLFALLRNRWALRKLMCADETSVEGTQTEFSADLLSALFDEVLHFYNKTTVIERIDHPICFLLMEFYIFLLCRYRDWIGF